MLEQIVYFIIAVVFILLVKNFVEAFKFRRPRLIVSIIAILILVPLTLNLVITLYTTSIPEREVPELIGLSEELAFAKYDKLGIRLRVVMEEFDEKFPEGVIIAQRPEAGKRVKAGRMVYLTVSKGPEPIPEKEETTEEATEEATEEVTAP